MQVLASTAWATPIGARATAATLKLVDMNKLRSVPFIIIPPALTVFSVSRRLRDHNRQPSLVQYADIACVPPRAMEPVPETAVDGRSGDATAGNDRAFEVDD
jgi:hypothetical protein